MTNTTTAIPTDTGTGAGAGAGSGVASVVTAARVRVTDNPVRVGAPVVQLAHGEPRVQLIREDGAVRAIEVTCGCGEKIRIRCDYT